MSDRPDRWRLHETGAAVDGPLRVPAQVWAMVVLFTAACYGVMFIGVHPRVDTRLCRFHLPDPLLPLIPHDVTFSVVARDLYYLMTIGSVLALALVARRRDHRPLLRFGFALAFMALFRSLTLSLVPACRATETVGTAPLAELPIIDLGFIEVPLRTWAVNDLMFSGHVAEFLILFMVLRQGPAYIVGGLVVWQVAQAYSLLATRDHYLLDMAVAVPFAILCERLGTAVVDRLAALVKPPPSG